MILSRKTWFAALAIAFSSALPQAATATEFGTTIQANNSNALVIEVKEGQILRLNREADSIFIADPGIADLSVRSSRMVYVFGKRPGETSLFALDANDRVIANTKVVVEHNISRLQGALDNLMPGTGVRATSFDGGIILSGTLFNATQAEDARRLAARFVGDDEEVINQMNVAAPNQVNLRVRIAEVSRDITNQLGFNWDAAFSASGFALAASTGLPLGVGGFVDTASSIGNFDLNSFLDFMEEDGLVSILAEPNLTALSGETASFLAGGEFPILARSDDDGISVEFKQFGVSLAFTPTILSQNRISMRVRPEVSSLSESNSVSADNFIFPSLVTRRAETTVELGSGQSFAIAGLILDNQRQSLAQVPGLGDIPVLGALFQSDSFTRNETELVIIVTPYLVKPMASPDMVADPVRPFTTPQTMTGVQGGNSSASAPQMIPLQSSNANGSHAAGFIVE